MFIIGLLRKLQRQVTAFFPVASNRIGECGRCGDCCKLPYPCPMLRYDQLGKSRCAVYLFRPLSCRVYPRTPGEHLTGDTCGFRFTGEQLQPVPVTLSVSAGTQADADRQHPPVTPHAANR
ncbi:MAG: hypothetical protein ACYC26_04025 [Phycisphaerales bacterium]